MLAVDRNTPLAAVTFCVLDLETTGTSDEFDEIVEIGAVLVRGGEQLGTFQTMVRHPLATGPADVPALPSVLASLLEFIRGAVIVGHNIGFDLRFLNAALWKTGHDVVLHPHEAVDTVPLARRLLRDDADDCRLGTLAQRFQFHCRPTHRALADAQATVELLHLLIDRATHYGALDLDDLMRLPGLMRHPSRAKLAVTARLPRAPGVARLLDRNGQTMHVVLAEDLRHAVRRLFDRDDPLGEPLGAPRDDLPSPTVLRNLHRVSSVHAQHPVVAMVVALRWAATIVKPATAPMAYLQHSSRTGKLRVVADPFSREVVAGPLPRPQARHVVSVLALRPVDDTARFVAMLTSDDALAAASDALDSVTADVVHRQRVLSAALAFSGVVHVQRALVSIDHGRIRDVEIDGRSVAGDLPMVDDSDGRPGHLPTAAHAVEAMYVASLLSATQPDCEILDT